MTLSRYFGCLAWILATAIAYRYGGATLGLVPALITIVFALDSVAEAIVAAIRHRP